MTKWHRLTVNLDPRVAIAAKELARRQHRSFASYVAVLIERDLAATKLQESALGLACEDPGTYETPAKSAEDELGQISDEKESEACRRRAKPGKLRD